MILLYGRIMQYFPQGHTYKHGYAKKKQNMNLKIKVLELLHMKTSTIVFAKDNT